MEVVRVDGCCLSQSSAATQCTAIAASEKIHLLKNGMAAGCLVSHPLNGYLSEHEHIAIFISLLCRPQSAGEPEDAGAAGGAEAH